MADEVKDDLRGDINAAMEELSGTPAEAPILEQPQETETQRADRERDEAGRFKAKDTERPTLSLKEKPEAQANPTQGLKAESSPASPTAPLAPDGKQPVETIAPPMEWKGAGKVKWDRLPREVQTELRDTWQAMATERAEVAPVKELLDVNREFLVNQAGSLPAALTQLMQFARMSVDNPRELIQHIARTTGTDLRALVAGQPPQGAPQGQPDATAYIAQLVQQQLQPIVGQFEQQRTNQVMSEIEAFRADPKNPYFNDVAPRIEGLLKAGAAKDLREAYDQAIWADPNIRQQLMSAQAEEASRARAAEVEKANKARSASLRGSPLPGASLNGTGNPNASALDDARAAYAEVEGA
jgi:hypothetical protein